MSDKREILYRGKRIDNKEWIEGYHAVIGKREAIIAYPEMYYDEDGKERFGNEIEEVDPETVCEHTGLADRNGKKIFEGDIIPYLFDRPTVGVVRYGVYRNPFNDDEHAGHMGFYVDWGKEKDRLRADLGYWAKVAEVIGNIFDNPELIEGGSVNIEKKLTPEQGSELRWDKTKESMERMTGCVRREIGAMRSLRAGKPVGSESYWSLLWLEYLQGVIGVMEKQIPKVPAGRHMDEDETERGYCPSCGGLISELSEHCYCGQAIDWEG